MEKNLAINYSGTVTQKGKQHTVSKCLGYVYFGFFHYKNSCLCAKTLLTKRNN